MLREVPNESVIQNKKRSPRVSRKMDAHMATEQVGQRLRVLRKARNLSIRSLAELSGLSVNTLSLIENGKTSPSVTTLHHLAESLNVSITAFFENEQKKKRVVYQKAGERQQIVFSQGQMEKLSEGMPPLGSEPFITKLEPKANSGDAPVIFAGREFIYCLEGHITYTVEGETYSLSPGDSLIFDAYMPHSWRNTAATSSCALLVLCPIESPDGSSERFFMP
jgi:transcriptional regulator with XRE-family HTH domain